MAGFHYKFLQRLAGEPLEGRVDVLDPAARIGARQHDLRALRLLVHLDDHGADPLALAPALVARLLGAGDDRLGATEVDADTTEVVAAFTTRAGGVSPAPFSGLNLGGSTGDDVESVRSALIDLSGSPSRLN